MKLKLNDTYSIETDQNNYILVRSYISPKNNKTYTENVSYCSSIDKLIKILLEREIMTDDTLTSFQAILTHLETLTEQIVSTINTYGKP